MSAKILEKQQLSENVYKMVLDGPKIARKRKAGSSSY
jgi:NAD(P)H-flavin reductase